MTTMSDRHKTLKSSDLEGAQPITEIVTMKNWNDRKQRWDGVACQAFRLADGSETIVIYDVGSAETQVGIDDWGRASIRDRPWEKSNAKP